MNQQDGPHLEDAGANGLTAWRFLGMWRTIAAISIVLLFLTFNPLLSGLLPYLRAGWPAVQTGFWLKMADPWKARGTVGFLFHLCMAGFRAGACGVVCLIVTVIAAEYFNRRPVDMIPMIIALVAILFGCFLSFVLGWLGVAIALRYGVRVFVISNLYERCQGDFDVAKTLLPPPHRTNPANFIVAMSAGVTLLAIWFISMLAILPADWNKEEGILPGILLGLLPVILIACIAVVIFLSKRIIAQSPADCWGAAAPELEEVDSNWYRTTD